MLPQSFDDPETETSNSQGFKMGAGCAVVGCSNRSNKDKKFRYFRFPAMPKSFPLIRMVEKMRMDKLTKWMNALHRADFPVSKAKCAIICSKHFITGRPSDDPNDPDYVPSLHMGSNKIKSGGNKIRRDNNKKKVTCCVLDCANKHQGPIFYKFPQSLLLVNLWKSALKIGRIKDVTNFYVCEHHFDRRDFMPGTNRLKSLAIPSIQRNDKKQTQISTPKTVVSNCHFNGERACEKEILSPPTSAEVELVEVFHNYTKHREEPSSTFETVPPSTVEAGPLSTIGALLSNATETIVPITNEALPPSTTETIVPRTIGALPENIDSETNVSLKKHTKNTLNKFEENTEDSVVIWDKNARVVISTKNVSLREKLVREIQKVLAKNCSENVATVLGEEVIEELRVPEDNLLEGLSKINGEVRGETKGKNGGKSVKIIKLDDSEKNKESNVDEKRDGNLSIVKKNREEVIVIDIRPDSRKNNKEETVLHSSDADINTTSTTEGSEDTSLKNYDTLISLRKKLKDFFDSFHRCPYCNYYEKNVQSLVFHVRQIHHGLFPEGPLAAEAIYRELINEIEKIQKEEEEFPVHFLNSFYKIYCQYCEECFPDIVLLIIHVKNVHETLNGPRPLSETQLASGMRHCKFCNRILDNLEEYRMHLARCILNPASKGYKEPIQVCEICGQTYSYKHLRLHLMYAHSDVDPSMTCEICNKSLSNKMNYNKHMGRHKKKPNVGCPRDEDKESFTNSASVQEYNRTVDPVSSNKQKFNCSICGRKFPTLEGILKHKDWHSTRCYKCPHCNAGITGMLQLHMHIKRFHKNTSNIGSYSAQDGTASGQIGKGKKRTHEVEEMRNFETAGTSGTKKRKKSVLNSLISFFKQ